LYHSFLKDSLVLTGGVSSTENRDEEIVVELITLYQYYRRSRAVQLYSRLGHPFSCEGNTTRDVDVMLF
jgi:hypothetical protein